MPTGARSAAKRVKKTNNTVWQTVKQARVQRWSQCSQGCTSYCVRLSGSRQVTHSALRSTSPLASETTSFSLRNWTSSRRGRFIARLFADKSESPPVIHSNDRYDVTLETNHLGLVTTKRSVVRWKNKQKMCKRSYLDSSTVSLSLTTVYERFVWEVSTIYALSPLPRRVTIHTGCCHQPPYQSILDYQDIKRKTENPT